MAETRLIFDEKIVLSFSERVGATTGLGNQPRDPDVQAITLVSSHVRQKLSELHGVLLMVPNRLTNEAVCRQLVEQLNFYSTGELLSFRARYPNTPLRLTYIYDSRSGEELATIKKDLRPRFFSKPDCTELISHFDFNLSHDLLNLLSINRAMGGPWLVAADPGRQRAVVFDLSRYKAEELSGAIDLWIEILQNSDRWRRAKFFEENFADLLTRIEPIKLIYLPDSFFN
jgi:hypothetical protein